METDSARKNSRLFYVILGYYALTTLFYFWRVDSFLKDIIIAPLYFLFPTGIGLLILSMFSINKKLINNLTRLQLILTASFLGFILITLVYLHLNYMGYLEGIFVVLYPALNLLSLCGFYNARGIFQADEDFKRNAVFILRLIPLFLLFYYFHFMHFASFPLRDIFMEVHFLKGAMELSKYHIVNIATGDSYIPLLQVYYGLLNHFYGYDLINSQWILPFYSFIFHILCIYCFYASFIKDRFILAVSLMFTIIFFQYFPNTNGQFLFSLSLLLFSLMIIKNKENTRLFPVVAETIALIIITIILYFNRRLPAVESTFLPFLIGFLSLMSLASYFNLNKLLSSLAVILMLFLAVPLHRGVIMTIPLILGLYLLYFACFQWVAINNFQTKYMLLKKAIKYSIICPPAGIVLGILIYKELPFFGEFIKNLMERMHLFFGGDGGYSYIGIIGILAEWVRIVPPAFHFMFLLLAIGIFVAVKRNYSEARRILVEANIKLILLCIISLFVLFVMYFMPLPHIQRIVLYPALIISALAGFMFRFYFNEDTGSKKILIIPIAMLIYTVMLKFIYDMPWKYQYEIPPYVSELSPIPEIALTVMVLLVIIMIFRWKTSLVWFFAFAVIFSGIALDSFKIISKLYESPYGTDFPEPKIISHYSLTDLKAARQIEGYLKAAEGKGDIKASKQVLMSDPYTLGIFEAVTGNNGFYTFSNLGQFIQPQYTRDLNAILRRAFPPFDDKVVTLQHGGTDFSDNNIMIASMLGDFAERYKGAMPEARYALHKKFGIPRNHAANGDPLGWNIDDFRRNILWVVNEKTIRWAYGEVGYYPLNAEFKAEYINKYILPAFDVIYNLQNKVLALKLK